METLADASLWISGIKQVVTLQFIDQKFQVIVELVRPLAFTPYSNLNSPVCNITTFLFSDLFQLWERDAPSTTLFLLAVLRGKRSAIIATHGAWWILSNWKHEQVLEYLVNQQGWSQSVGLLSPSDRGGLKSSWGFRQFGSSVNFDQLCNHIGLGIYQVYTISRRSLTTS